MDNKKRIFNSSRFMIIIIMLIVVVIGGTFAWFSFSSRKSALVLSIGDINDSKVTIKPYQIRETMTPVNAYTSGVYSQITAINNNSNRFLLVLFYKINNLDDVLINNGLKYTIVSSDSIDGTYTEVKTGDFKDISDNKIEILRTDITPDATEHYRVYLWLDSSIGNQVEVENSTIDIELNGSIESTANAPVLDDGMIPVVISDDGVVKTIDENDSNWYDYSKKKWANMVLVNNDSNIAFNYYDNSDNGQVVGATYVDGGLSFDGSDDYINVSSFNVTLPATYSVRFMTNSSNNQIIFGDYNTKVALGLYNSNNSFVVSLNENTYVVNTGGLNVGQYYNVDIVANSLTDIDVYLDGVMLSNSTSMDNWNWYDSNSYIGKRSTGANFNGIIERLIVYDDVLSIDEMQHNLSINNYKVCDSGVICDNLKLYYNFDGNKRGYYTSNVNVNVREDDILAYYVWIPRYKYRVWTTGMSSAGNEQSIGIVFESQDEPMTKGTTVGSYRTHPAFWWDDNSNGEVENGEMIPGMWVGKFETTGDATTPTVKPNLQSLRNQNVSTKFQTSLKFAGGTMNVSNGNVSFTGNNTYGLTKNSDSHMMKNSEWGAVAYLSHSQYGINEEIYINNSSGYYTGRSGGAGSGGVKDLATQFSDASLSNENKYNLYGYYTWLGQNIGIDGTVGMISNPMLGTKASTTGNVTGIYDMSGGAYDYVMGVLSDSEGNPLSGYYPDDNSGFNGITYDSGNNTLFTDGISVPDSKYYDLYLQSQFNGDHKTNIELCTLETCGGHALFETNNWYNNLNSIFHQKGYPWLFRGEYFNCFNVGTTGIFSFMAFDGTDSYDFSSFHSVIITKNISEVTFDLNGGEFETIETMNYSTYGQYQYVVPHDGLYKLEAWGAQGGSGPTSDMGYGGYTSGKVKLNSDDILYFNVGGQGQNHNSYGIGGYNGGGYTYNGSSSTRGASGGGATDVRYNSNTLNARIMVAGGGGGGGSNGIGIADAGGLIGYDGYSTSYTYYAYVGKGGTQIAGGSAPSFYSGNSTSGTAGSFGQGGSGGGNNSETSTIGGGAGGGGGYYGGSGSSGMANGSSSAGGGSSYISGHDGCIAITSESSTIPVTTSYGGIENSYHYSGKVFTDTVMIDGGGYSWTNVKKSQVQMPNPLGGNYSLGIGHSGHGAAKISLVNVLKELMVGELYGDMPTPTKDGYEFIGWSTVKDDYSTLVTSDSIVNIIGDHTLYALFSSI